MTTIYLVRHGEAAASWAQARDPGLSELGRGQAGAAAAALGGRGIATIVSSPLARAQETAAPLASALALPVEVDERFRELPSKVPLDARAAWLHGIMRSQWDSVGEELCAWRDSAWAALLGFERPTAVFTHFMLINAMVSRATGSPQLVCFEPDNGSITVLRGDGALLRVVETGAARATQIL